MINELGSCLTISLDFELHWGVLPSYTVEQYKQNLEGTADSVEKSLRLFQEYEIHATWATVGFLFYEGVAKLLEDLPVDIPAYSDPKMNSYLYLSTLNEDYAGHFHFAPELIDKIAKVPHQEIGTHTFSHYFCLEEGQRPEQFRADLDAAKRAAANRGIELKSIVFPRNQYNQSYLGICKEFGISNIRGCPKHYAYAPRDRKADKRLDIRAIRLLDSYLNVTGQQTIQPSMVDGIVDVPATRQYKPYVRKLRKFEKFKVNRIKQEMTSAAQKQETYHLWWHPHNLGNHVDENIDQLQSIFQHYENLNSTYGMRSLNMREIGEVVVACSDKQAST